MEGRKIFTKVKPKKSQTFSTKQLIQNLQDISEQPENQDSQKNSDNEQEKKIFSKVKKSMTVSANKIVHSLLDMFKKQQKQGFTPVKKSKTYTFDKSFLSDDETTIGFDSNGGDATRQVTPNNYFQSYNQNSNGYGSDTIATPCLFGPNSIKVPQNNKKQNNGSQFPTFFQKKQNQNNENKNNNFNQPQQQEIPKNRLQFNMSTKKKSDIHSLNNKQPSQQNSLFYNQKAYILEENSNNQNSNNYTKCFGNQNMNQDMASQLFKKQQYQQNYQGITFQTEKKRSNRQLQFD